MSATREVGFRFACEQTILPFHLSFAFNDSSLLPTKKTTLLSFLFRRCSPQISNTASAPKAMFGGRRHRSPQIDSAATAPKATMARGGRQRSRLMTPDTDREATNHGGEESIRRHEEMEMERLLDEHRDGMVVRTGITCRHDQYPILACSWSGMDAGRRFLQCSNVENPCDFKYWIDSEFSGRPKQVIQDLVSMNGSLSELVVHFHGQWDEMLGSRQQAQQEMRKLKAIVREQRSCIGILLCICIVMACGLCLLFQACMKTAM